MCWIFYAGFLLLLIDFIFSIGSFGFYDTSFGFNITIFKNNLCFLTDGYYFTKNGFDFLLFFVLRLVLIAISIYVLFKTNQTKTLSLFYFGFDICNASYSLTKILAFAEYPIQLSYYGIWMSISWNIIAQILIHLFYSRYLCNYFEKRKNILNNYEQLHNESAIPNQQNGDVQNETIANEPERKSTLVYVFFLLKLCFFFWKWFSAGFFFLIIYAVGKQIF